ncbi:hypothetical protein [Streptomyces sp. NBC_01451]|uniref:hypothetical protein n=1 Tax=Streptomyces sp. NBC_01451 TaxID=2903872 RepID=UPI002E2F4CA2|nr:hypothetical protein [Streptomyces sp. NBC_01451]
MTEVQAQAYEEDPEWDGAVEGEPAESDDVVDVPKRRGRAPLTLPTLAGKYERAKVRVERLEDTDVEAERDKVRVQMERLTERLARLDGHEAEIKEARAELTDAEREFHAALAAVQG